MYSCGGLGLTSASHAYTSLATIIILNDNFIVEIEDTAFDGLLNLEILVLSGNGITSVTAGAFDNLPSLEHLYLDENDISSISTGAFRNLASLTILQLSDNVLICANVAGSFNGTAQCGMLSHRNLRLHVFSLGRLGHDVCI
eukprot:m.1435331 g.1435331  ORF g.1435331 m.1435331 type:complete len:142 (+) comp25082_c0_seq7:290-715(+)